MNTLNTLQSLNALRMRERDDSKNIVYAQSIRDAARDRMVYLDQILEDLCEMYGYALCGHCNKVSEEWESNGYGEKFCASCCKSADSIEATERSLSDWLLRA